MDRQLDRPWFLLTMLATSILHLGLHVASFTFVLRHVNDRYPAGEPAFLQQLQRPMGELVMWAMALTSLAMGWFITTVMRWSGAHSGGQGLRRGLALGLMFWIAINSGLYASSHFFSLPGMVADTLLSALCMTIASGFAVWMLHARPSHGGAPTATK